MNVPWGHSRKAPASSTQRWRYSGFGVLACVFSNLSRQVSTATPPTPLCFLGKTINTVIQC